MAVVGETVMLLAAADGGGGVDVDTKGAWRECGEWVGSRMGWEV